MLRFSFNTSLINIICQKKEILCVQLTNKTPTRYHGQVRLTDES